MHSNLDGSSSDNEFEQREADMELFDALWKSIDRYVRGVKINGESYLNHYKGGTRLRKKAERELVKDIDEDKFMQLCRDFVEYRFTEGEELSDEEVCERFARKNKLPVKFVETTIFSLVMHEMPRFLKSRIQHFNSSFFSPKNNPVVLDLVEKANNAGIQGIDKEKLDSVSRVRKIVDLD